MYTVQQKIGCLVTQSMKVGALDIVDGWMEGDAEVYKFVTKLEVDKYVPKSLQRHFSKEGLHYTDIITYDPKLIARAPYRLPVKSIAPILPEKVHLLSMPCPLLYNSLSSHHVCEDVWPN